MTDDRILAGQRHLWALGDYPAVARRLAPISDLVVERLRIGPNDRVLDIATGDGNAAIRAAQRGATVVGIDLTPTQIEFAAERCAELGLEVDLRVGNAEHLEFEDASFDVVMSVMGLIFAPDHHRAAAEMARVVRPGGRVAMTSWAPGGWFDAWRAEVSGLMGGLPAGGPDPDGWSPPDAMRDRLTEVGLDVEVEVVDFAWEFDSVPYAADFFLSSSGPFILFMEGAAREGNEAEARAMLMRVLADSSQARGGGCRLSAPFTLATGTR